VRNILWCCCVFLLSFSALALPLGQPIRYAKTSEKIVLLSFDDGPSEPYTAQILDILARHQVKATFFVVGVNVKKYPHLIKRIIEEGHDLGNHSWTHDNLKKKSKAAMQQDILKTDEAIRALGYEKTIPFRAPFGQMSAVMPQALSEIKKPHILFNFLAKDWENPPPEVITDRVLQQAKPGFIVTLHDGWNKRENTVKATDLIVKALKDQGYRFVSASEFLEYPLGS
jgi:peptidoglycan-N-acetylglucosamine deacetylase